MTTLLALAMWMMQFVHDAPNTPVTTAPVLRFQLPPTLTDCKLVPPYKLTVLVSLTVGVDGNTHGVRIVRPSGNACVDKQELIAANHYRFSPALKETRPIPATITMTMYVSRDR